MYIPSKFEQHDTEQLSFLIRQYPLATLVTHTDSGLDAMHLPMLLSGGGDALFLKGHIARANPLWKSIGEGAEVLVVFNGPNCYISPNHYPTKAENGRVVPTWNYLVVHVKGRISFVHDTAWIHNLVDELTSAHESGREHPWSIGDAPETYTRQLISAIVGVRIEVGTITGKWKLSQNQPEVNQQGVVQGLFSGDDHNGKAIASIIADNFDLRSGKAP
ncbi:FMN-binding negative transcriptional regulator [Parahaliea maris]|uniref:FMN-binding negative transcriptional regulator n=1 Tax=Parahaliea maris TaxID=2716870 RepID=A0A5C8ZZH1_9GAMM|nr:FMN-binding negative transcriptional regulator [Parahaliea maris]TXS93896.1 FMN-binding negative transcriptional regulator [Parahaliea maris]